LASGLNDRREILSGHGMNENIKWSAAAVGVVGLAIAAVVYRDSWWKDRPKPPAEKPVAAAPEQLPAPEEEAAATLPPPVTDSDEALPPLDSSDPWIRASLADLVGQESVEKYFIPENLVRQIVVSVDNLPEQKVAERIRPLKRVPGQFVVAGTEEEPVLDPANYPRYEPLVKLVTSMDTQQLMAFYARYYPLFQESYENLGHPPRQFNDRLVAVIDHLLATPEVRDPVALARPNVLYEFADPKLEALSAGQKLLIRMGSANANSVKAKLKELRAALVAAGAGQ
jgi:hypothetical protein